jgi:hypothetical protein
VPRHPQADEGGIPPPPRYANCTVTEVTELSFRRKEHSAYTVGPCPQAPAASATPVWRVWLFASVRGSWSLPSPCVVLISPVDDTILPDIAGLPTAVYRRPPSLP